MTPGKYPDKKLANLIIAGVNKAGTTSLFHYLSAHPQICGSRDKETCYFLPLLYDQQLAPIQEYEAQFTHCSVSKYRLEATPGYVTGGEKMAEVISETLDDAKIIIILKDPADRLISFYHRKKATLQLPHDLSFKEFVKRCRELSPEALKLQQHHLYSALATGEYHSFLEPWLKTFGDRVKIVFFDDLKNTRIFMQDIARWLQIDSLFYDHFDFDVKNKSMNYKNPVLQKFAVIANQAGQRLWRSNPGFKKNLMAFYYKLNGTPFEKEELDGDTVEFLKSYYLPHNQKLQLLLSRYGINVNTPSWLKLVTEAA
ncbi:MAG: sulfotransferase domain-containing protein [Bacteroidota bacterium]|nr:sulfotransferase domain-containing protein [Bacteroidota bacterium]